MPVKRQQFACDCIAQSEKQYQLHQSLFGTRTNTETQTQA